MVKIREHLKSNQRNNTPLSIHLDLSKKAGVAAINWYIGDGPYRGENCLDAHTKWAIVAYMDHAWPVEDQYTNADQAKTLSIDLKTYYSWRRSAAQYRKEHKGCKLPETASNPKNPRSTKAKGLAVSKSQRTPEDDLKSSKSDTPMPDDKMAAFCPLENQPDGADSLDITEGPISLVYLDLTIYGLTVDSAAALILKLRSG